MNTTCHRHFAAPVMALVAMLAVTTTAIAGAEAYTVAGLGVDFADHLDDRLEDEIDAELGTFFEESYRYDWLAPDVVADRLGGAPDCFDQDCLVDYGERLNARVGLVIVVEEQNQIYDWELTYYDLASGQSLATEAATCELCGRSEVVSQFRTSLQSSLTLLDLDDQAEEPIEPTVDDHDAATEVRISVVPDDTRIFLDEEPVGVGDISLELDEGTYEVRFSHDTHHGLRETIIVTEDSAPLFVMRVHLRQGAGTQRTIITRGNGLVDQIEDQRVIIGASALGVGAGLTILSFILSGIHGQPACDASVPVYRCPEVYDTNGWATTTTILGTLSMAGGAALIAWPWLAGEADAPAEAGLNLSPTVGQGFGGLNINGRF